MALNLHQTLMISRDNLGWLNPRYPVFGTADGSNSFLLTDADGAIHYWPLAFDLISHGDNEARVATKGNSMPEFISDLRTLEGSV